MTKKTRITLRLVALSVVLCASVLLLLAFLGCEEECLVEGENCSASYKEANYGTTDIWCCEGTCRTNMFGDSVCRY
jgi:hypothetical protein